MATRSTISISFKLDGDSDGLKKLTIDADGFRKAMGAMVIESKQ